MLQRKFNPLNITSMDQVTHRPKEISFSISAIDTAETGQIKI